MPLTLICTTTDKRNVTFKEALFGVFSSRQTTAHDTQHLIIVNDDDGEACADIDELVRDDPTCAKISANEYWGVGQSRQRALTYAEKVGADYLLFIDDDIIAPGEIDWIENFVAPFADPSMFAVGPFPVVITEDWETMWYTRNPRAAHYIDSPYAIHVGYSVELGGYDPFFKTCGENGDLMVRALGAGKTLLGIQNPGLLHYHQMTIGDPDYHFAPVLEETRRLEHEELRRRYPPGWHGARGLSIAMEHTVNRSSFIIDVDRGRGRL